MKKLVVIVAAILIALPCVASSKKAVFIGTAEEVFEAAVKAAQSNWSVKFADRKAGLLTFTTGMSFTSNGTECSAVVKAIDNGRVEVTLTPHKKAQVFAWDVGKRIADKFFAAITEQLALARAAPAAPESK